MREDKTVSLHTFENMAIAAAVLAIKVPMETILAFSCRQRRPFIRGTFERSHYEKFRKAHCRKKFVCCAESPHFDEKMRSASIRSRYESEVMILARQVFCKEISSHKSDDAVSLVKSALLILAEDQAFISLNREKDDLAVQNEISLPLVSSPARERWNVNPMEVMIGDLSISGWMDKIDGLVSEVDKHLNDDGLRRQPLQILKAVNVVLCEAWDFIQAPSSNDPLQSYIDHALTFGSGTGVLLGIIFMEVFRRLGVKMEGTAVNGTFLVWPHLDDSVQMVFEPCKGGKSWMIEEFSQWRSSSSSQHKSDSSIGRLLDISVVQTLEPKSNRDILIFILKSLKSAYWKKAAKPRPGLTPDSALRLDMTSSSYTTSNAELPVGAMLRPEDLQLAVMASERLVLLEPRNWAIRKEHGMLLYHRRRYDEAVRELSICIALAPLREEESLQPFVERLHLMRTESTWDIFSSSNSPSAFV
ncbi:uncharacterized protein [Physcomitrium patens]|uniref:Protein SirB1 N-terminal domain-containing protein n=1 Tax=Physcomitrium patens TaxID=3218 RepID=A0A7I4DJM1_PHYPA|nr:uncharacterized protein LOC112281370 isoform X2 [Physcomitrium patens]|eukprot:XP_024373562.1 uncharacterized protein LOC112281370 isoform X2 [Physcomitrella patens]